MKKKHHEDHVNHEAWAIPYADLMTLLLAFFVVMYAVSVVNEGKYRVMSESIIEAFNGSSHVIAAMPESRAKPHNVDPAVASPQSQPGAAVDPLNVPIPSRPSPARVADARSAQMRDQRRNLETIRDHVQRALQPLIDKQMVVVRKTATWLEIELRTDILFNSGEAKLSGDADEVLDQLAAILKPFSNPVHIEGYTDDRPINTTLYPSNWELSAARAASVARLFTSQGVEPSRLGIVGWGEYHPSADNGTEDGRNHNRRVQVVVLSDEYSPRRLFDNDQRAGRFADDAPATPPVRHIDDQPQGAALPAASHPVSDSAVGEATQPPGNAVPDRAPLNEFSPPNAGTPALKHALPGANANVNAAGHVPIVLPDHGP